MRILKTFEALFLPSTAFLLAVMLTLLLLVRRRYRAATGVLALTLVAGGLIGTPWFAGTLVNALERPFASPFSGSQSPSAVVVLAGAATVYPNGRVDLNVASWRRLWRGIEAYHAFGGKVPLIYAGGSFNRRTREPIESRMVTAVAVRAGVNPARLVFEDGSSTTFESASAITRLWPGRLQEAPRRVALVTSAWHLRRSVAVFEAQGFEVDPIPTDFRGRSGPMRAAEWVPGLGALGLTELAWREWASVLLYEFTGRT